MAMFSIFRMNSMPVRLLAATAILSFLFSCSGPQAERSHPFPVDRLGDMVYQGTQSGPVQLVAGIWQGAPYDPEGATRPEVDLAGGDPLLGDLDGDGSDDAVVVLTEQLGGSGIFVYLAAVVQGDEGLTNVATLLLGDRVGITSLAIDDRTVVADLVVAGPGDTACCPTHRERAVWRLENRELREISREARGAIERDR
jgi:hypothetical protein